jgi:plasmid stability protein
LQDRTSVLALLAAEVVGVATLVIRDLDEAVKARLRVRAASNGRSMEAEARAILGAAVAESTTGRGLGSRIRQRFADVDDVDIVPPRTEQPRAADFAA